MARKMKRFAEGGDAYQTARRARKEADIESDYQKALKAGKNAQIALAKKEQRMADAADDFAKWTRSDRTQTRAAERAAEMALSQARRTQGRSIADRDLGSRINPTPEKPMDLSGIKTDLSSVKTPSVTPTRRATSTPSRRTAPQAPARREEAPRSRGTWYDRPTSSASPGASPAPKAPPPQPTTSQSSNKAPSLYIGEVAARRQARNVPSRMSVDLADIGRNYEVAGQETRAKIARDRARIAAQRAREFAEQAAAERAAKRPPMPLSQWPQDQLSQFTPEDTDSYPLKAMRKGGTAKAKPMMKKPVKKYAKGGSIDGCAVRGKTRAKRTK